jgi:hypothetical protein
LAAFAAAQNTTEIFIPIGRSPGLSGTKTSIGTIESVDVADQTLVLTEDNEERTVRCNEHTRIWLDRSKQRQPNIVGSLADCRATLRVEVKYVDNAKDIGVAEWIKVEIIDQ